jgi:hypothetical protein
MVLLPEPAAVVEKALTVKGQRVMRFRGYNKSFNIVPYMYWG